MGVLTAIKSFLKRTYPDAFLKVSGAIVSKATTRGGSKRKHAEAFDGDDWEEEDKDKVPQEDAAVNLKLRSYIRSPFTPGTGHKDQYKFPSDVNVCIHDATGKLKVYPSSFKGTRKATGLSFVMDYVLAEANAFLNLPNTEAFYVCFDRGSPANKGEEQSRRRKNIKLMDVLAVPDDQALIDDTTLPSEDEWQGFTNHPKLQCELLHYISKRIIEPHPVVPGNTYTPPLSPNGKPKALFLFGGDLSIPSAFRADRVHKQRPKGCLYFVENVPQDGKYGFKSHRNHGLYGGADFTESEMEWLLEGEMSASYFSKPYSDAGKNVMIISGGGDGDVIMQTLLACKDRIDLRTGLFKNKVYVRLIVAGTTEDVDINKLYELIKEDPDFKGVEDPELLIVAASCLAKNDYFSGFGKGLGNIKKDKDSESPTILHTLIKHASIFGNELIKTSVYQRDGTLLYDDHNTDHLAPPTRSYSGAMLPGPHGRSGCYPYIRVQVDEDVFIKYTKQCYVERYFQMAARSRAGGKQKQRKESIGMSKDIPTIGTEQGNTALKLVNDYLNVGKKVDNRIMATSEIRVYARMLEWTLEYFYNGYRAGAQNIITTVLATFGGHSYYGWVPASLDVDFAPTEEEPDPTCLQIEEPTLVNTKCKRATVVSIKRPTDRHLHISPSTSRITLTLTTDSSSSTSVKSTIEDRPINSRFLGNAIESHLTQTLQTSKQSNECHAVEHSQQTPSKVVTTIVASRSANDEPDKKKQRVGDQTSITVSIAPQTTMKPVGIDNIPIIRSHLSLKKKQ